MNTKYPPSTSHTPIMTSESLDSVVGAHTSWTRRAWVMTTAQLSVAAFLSPRGASTLFSPTVRSNVHSDACSVTSGVPHTELLDPGPVQALAQHAVDAARAAGASYADARLTRDVMHHYQLGGASLTIESEFVGFGIRVLVNGCWAFTSAALWLSEPNASARVVQLAHDAVAQAKTIADALPILTPVELSPTPVVTGTWETPCRIDPFKVSLEEKRDTMATWSRYAGRLGVEIAPIESYVNFVRQERVAATSDGSLFTQTCYESGGLIIVRRTGAIGARRNDPSLVVQNVAMAGQGWERLLDAKIPEQILAWSKRPAEQRAPTFIGRYTLVCDGSTMASILGESIGVATQLDRALGYEANRGGTSFLNDPLAMLGSFKVASPLLTVTANRSAPTQLATVKWDDEGVVPRETALITAGVLTDFQTTREQAMWLAPYYKKAGRPVVSNGYAGGQNAMYLTMQMRPNLAMAPSASSARIEDLIGSVKNGLLLKNCSLSKMDFQARNGLLVTGHEGEIRRIVNGRVGGPTGSDTTAIQVNAPQLLQQVNAIGDVSTTETFSSSQFDFVKSLWPAASDKGDPPQRTSYSAQGAAALIDNQAVIELARKA